MTRVWSVLVGLEGSLADWSVEGVFTSEDLARRAAADAVAREGGATGADVIVHDLDRASGELVDRCYLDFWGDGSLRWRSSPRAG